MAVSPNGFASTQRSSWVSAGIFDRTKKQGLGTALHCLTHAACLAGEN